jgi:hypothetical protein
MKAAMVRQAHHGIFDIWNFDIVWDLGFGASDFLLCSANVGTGF